MSGDFASIRGALALELSPGTVAGRLALAQDAARVLADWIGLDLQRNIEGEQQLALTVLGAHFDPTELLQPGWPLYRDLADLARRAPGEGARVLAIGSRDGGLPDNLSPDENRVGGPLRLVPFVLTGEPAQIEVARHALETSLLETGMASAACALHAQTAFAAQIEHARYLTLYDLLALTALQYEHAGLGAIWPLIESALLDPAAAAELDAAPEPRVRLHPGGKAVIGLPSAAGRALRLRCGQLQALLQAHAINAEIVPDDPTRG